MEILTIHISSIKNELKKKWGEEDSNLRRLRQQSYSLPHLTALVSPHNFLLHLFQ